MAHFLPYMEEIPGPTCVTDCTVFVCKSGFIRAKIDERVIIVNMVLRNPAKVKIDVTYPQQIVQIANWSRNGRLDSLAEALRRLQPGLEMP
jgi:hypothetical protein